LRKGNKIEKTEKISRENGKIDKNGDEIGGRIGRNSEK